MKPEFKSRRKFLMSAGLGAAGLVTAQQSASALGATKGHRVDEELNARILEALKKPVLRKSLFKEPVIIESVELLKRDDQHFVVVRSSEGHTGICLTNRTMIRHVYPLFLRMITPFFIGKDARDLDTLIDGVFSNSLNYKWQGMAFWVCVAWMEFALLDLLGHTVSKPVGELLGDRIRDKCMIYYANGDRRSSAAEVIDQLKALIAKSGAKAVKFKLGGRMRFDEASNRRDRELIPLARAELGDETTLKVDSNSSFDVATAISMGKLLSEYNYDFFEEPVQFDHYEETKMVADALEIPIAGGEQESSMRRFRWLMENGAVQVAQPDLLHFGGMIRSIRVARMADALGLRVTPHMSGFGLGILHVLHFASIVENAGDFQEYKGDKDGIPYQVIDTGQPIQSVKGVINVPKAPGFGVEFNKDYLASAVKVSA